MVATPPAGNHPKLAAKTSISISASQKDGTEMPAKQARLTAPSIAEPGRRAAMMPSGSASA